METQQQCPDCGAERTPGSTHRCYEAPASPRIRPYMTFEEPADEPDHRAKPPREPGPRASGPSTDTPGLLGPDGPLNWSIEDIWGPEDGRRSDRTASGAAASAGPAAAQDDASVFRRLPDADADAGDDTGEHDAPGGHDGLPPGSAHGDGSAGTGDAEPVHTRSTTPPPFSPFRTITPGARPPAESEPASPAARDHGHGHGADAAPDTATLAAIAVALARPEDADAPEAAPGPPDAPGTGDDAPEPADVSDPAEVRDPADDTDPRDATDPSDVTAVASLPATASSTLLAAALPPDTPGAPDTALPPEEKGDGPRRRRRALMAGVGGAVALTVAALLVSVVSGGGRKSDDARPDTAGSTIPGQAGPSASGPSGADQPPGQPTASVTTDPSASGDHTSPTGAGPTASAPPADGSPRSPGPQSSNALPAPHALQEGDRGPEVEELQLRLRQLLLYLSPADGTYDTPLRDTVARYQKSRHISGDVSGVYGSATRAKLEAETREP